jgi:uncharacterized membrane protein
MRLFRPLARVPENAIKFAVGLLLATFGTFWAVEGLGVVTESRESVEWPGDLAIPALLVVWYAVSYRAVLSLRRAVSRPRGGARGPASSPIRCSPSWSRPRSWPSCR